MRILVWFLLFAVIAHGQGMFLPITTESTAILPANGKPVASVVQFSDGTMVIRFQCQAFLATDKATDQTRIELQAVTAFVANQNPIPLQQVFGFDRNKMLGFAARAQRAPLFSALMGTPKRYVLLAGQSGFLHIPTPAGLGIPGAAATAPEAAEQ